MLKQEDYYRILQVDELAEPEVIEGAYKRLAKKYHPDVNRGHNAESKMMLINKAFEVLGDPEARCRYDLGRKKGRAGRAADVHDPVGRHVNDEMYRDAKTVLERYFENIRVGRFELSYELTSESDRRKITRTDFIAWQSAVSGVFKLNEYSLTACRNHKNNELDGHRYDQVLEYSVNILEYNAVMDMTEKNVVTKMAVLENGKWRVYVGYDRLQPIIGKFEALAGLLDAKYILGEMAQVQSRTDRLTGLLNKKGISERIKSEIYRFRRYGSSFSLLLCEVDAKKANDKKAGLEARVFMMKSAAELLAGNLRELDAVGRCNENTFLILLPETNLASAEKVAEKISSIFDSARLTFEGKIYKLSVKFEAEEYTTGGAYACYY